MMFSGKLFTIISAVLAVAAAQGTVKYCVDANCSEVSIDPNVCKPFPDGFKQKITTFSYEGFTVCSIYSDPNCAQDPHSLPLKDLSPNDLAGPGIGQFASYFKCT